MAKTKKTETTADQNAEKTVNESAERHGIPTMGERPAPSRGPSGVIERHRRKHVPNAAKVKDGDRPVIDMPPETQEKFVDFARTKVIFDRVEAKKKSLQKEVSSEIWDEYVKALWTSKCQPTNPNIEAKLDGRLEATGQFIVSSGSKIKIDMPETGDGEEPEDALIRGLVNAGVSPHNAERLVSNEVSFVPTWTLNFTDLMRGEVKDGKINAPSQTQSSAAEILFCAINGEDLEGKPVSDSGRIELLKKIPPQGWDAIRADVDKRTTYYPILVDSKDFLDRACNYADSLEELHGVLTVFSPTSYCQRVVFAPGDSEATKNAKMVSAAKVIINE